MRWENVKDIAWEKFYSNSTPPTQGALCAIVAKIAKRCKKKVSLPNVIITELLPQGRVSEVYSLGDVSFDSLQTWNWKCRDAE